MVTVKINGKEITVDDGTLILDAARGAGFEIPTFCYQADLSGLGSCRMCLVEIEGQRKLQPSCVTPVIDGMNITTESRNVQSARSDMLEFLLSNHALDCPVCDKGGECELQDMVYTHGPRKGRHAEVKNRFHEKDYQLSPVIIKNSNRCVQCMKCVRVCSEVVGAGVLGGIGRGENQEETSFVRSFLDCDQDGNCIEVCPVGCFMRVPFRYKTRPWDLNGADSICTYCATGCRIVVEERDGTVIRSRAQLGVGLNSETLCARGRFGYDYVMNEKRLTKPLVRKDGILREATWDEALGTIKDNLRSGIGPRAGGIASERLTNEELFLFGKLMRGIIGTPNIDSSSRWDSAGVEGFIAATDMTGGGVSVFDCMESDSVLIIGTHLTEENPVIDYTVRRISATRFMNVIIASPRAMRLDGSASLTLRHNPAAEGALLGAVSLALKEMKGDELASVSGLETLEGRKGELTTLSGLEGGEITELADKLNSSSTIAIMAGTEFLRYPESTGGLSLLKRVLRALGKTVTVMPVLDRCNQRGAWEMGVHPSLEPGYAPAGKKGLGTTGMFEAAVNGGIETLYIAGADPVAFYPDQAFAIEALSKVPFIIVQDMFLTETAKLAHVVLPSAGASEKRGTFTNQEGRVQEITALLPPPGKSMTDHEIFASVGRLFDSSFGRKPREVFEEIRLKTSMYREVSLRFNNIKNKENNLDLKEALVAPCDAEVDVKTVVGARAANEADNERPFVLTTGNILFGSGNLSRRSDILMSLTKGPFVEISAEDAEAMGLQDGETVRVRGEGEEVVLSLKVSKGTKRGVAFIAENYEGVPVNSFFKKGKGLPRVGITRS